MTSEATHWHALVGRAAAAGPLVYIGTSLAHARALVDAGADVAATVEVLVAGDVPSAPLDGTPALSIVAPTRSNTRLQVPVFAETLEASAAEVARFLAAVDPHTQACVVSVLPVPIAATGSRPRWVADTVLAHELERKDPASSPLDGVVPWVTTEPVPASVDRGWWDDATARLGADRLVVQSLGLHAAGEHVWICDSVDEVRAALASSGPARASGFVDGESVNVMACVGADGTVLVLPPTRQLVAEHRGRALYAGNVVEELGDDVSAAITTGARAAGAALAGRGYIGVFGLDAIVDPAGRCHFHDLNARVNGVVHLLGAYVPAMAGMLTGPGWVSADTVVMAEKELAFACSTRPLGRWLLTDAREETGVARVPASGNYRVSVSGSRATPLDGGGITNVEDDVLFVAARCPAGWTANAGEYVSVADVWSSAALVHELEATYGREAMHALLAMLVDGDG